MQHGRKLQLLARRSSSIFSAPNTISQTFAVTHRQQRQQSAPGHAFIADLVEGKQLIFFAGTVEFVFVLAVKVEVSGEFFGDEVICISP